MSAVSVPQLAAWEEPLSLARMRLLPRSPSAHAINARRHDVSERAVSMRDASKPRVKVAKCLAHYCEKHSMLLRCVAPRHVHRAAAMHSRALRHGGTVARAVHTIPRQLQSEGWGFGYGAPLPAAGQNAGRCDGCSSGAQPVRTLCIQRRPLQENRNINMTCRRRSSAAWYLPDEPSTG